MSLIKFIQNKEIGAWVDITQTKLTLAIFCLKFNIDIENDRINKLFWHIGITHKVIINDEILTYMGYSGNFSVKNLKFRRLLHKKNINIEYEEVSDILYPRRKYVILDEIDFEFLLSQMRTSKASKLRNLFSLMKMSTTKYCEYEKLYSDRLVSQLEMTLKNVKR